jgi:hypothetical protein
MSRGLEPALSQLRIVFTVKTNFQVIAESRLRVDILASSAKSC